MGSEVSLHRWSSTLVERNTTDLEQQAQSLTAIFQPVSIIIPTLNESANIADLLMRLHQALAAESIPYEAIVIDDHSTDSTVLAAETIAREKHLPVRVLLKQGRAGKSFSLIEGFAVAQFDVFGMIDGDLQYPPEAFPTMIRQLANADIVIGDRRVHYHSVSQTRGHMSNIFGNIVNLFFGVDTDMQSGLKIFRRSVYEHIAPEPGKWSFDLHLVINALEDGYTVANTPIIYHPRHGGESKVTPLSVGIELLMAVFKLKVMLTLNSLKNSFGNRKLPETPFPQQDVAAATPPVNGTTTQLVDCYAAWLAAEALRRQNNFVSEQKEANEYVDYALRNVTIRGQKINVFAPFRNKHSALRTFTIGQLIAFGVVGLAIVLGLLFFRMPMLIAFIAVVTVFYLGDLLLTCVLSIRTLGKSAEERISDEIVQELTGVEWPTYTILCPLYREAKVVPQFVQAMQALDYPQDKLQVLFLTEEDDAETRDAIRAMGLAPNFEIVTVPDGQPRTKPRACNYGLLRATGEYTVIYDAEDIPDPLQLKKAVLTFAKQGLDVGCVQAKLNFYNLNQNLLTRWFTAEYSLWFDLTLPGLQRAKLPLPLGGTSNHFRTQILRTLGAWDAFNVTEDCDLGLRLSRYNLKTSVLDSTTYEEANSRPKNWLRQRSRWIKGYMQTYLVYMRQPLRYLQQGRVREFLALQLIVGGKTAVLFINPIMWLLLALYLLIRPIIGNTYHALFPPAILYMGTLSLIFGNFFYLYSHLVGCVRRRQYNLIKWTLLIPIYWVMNSIAAFVALQQLILKPHYWEKTHHGLHLSDNATSAENLSSVTEAIEFVETKKLPAVSTGGDVDSDVTKRRDGLNLSQPVWESETRKMAVPAVMSVLSPIPTVTEQVQAVRLTQKTRSKETTSLTLQLTNLSRPTPLWRQFMRDSWLVSTLLIACIASVTALLYFYNTHQILLYGDAYAHMLIARRLFDNATPGIAQIGGVWLPLPHLLMVPFVWNDYLWRTGLAGSIPAMMCYVIATAYIFLSARRTTKDNSASFVGTLLFVLNPNILYLQTTPLSELVLIATLMMACYHFIVWVQEDDPKQLVLAAVGTFLATIARYDGWFLFIALFVLTAIVCWARHRRWSQIEGALLVFSTLGGLGIALWMLWCAAIFRDPLYFQRGPFSAQAQQRDLMKLHLLFTNHDLLQSIRYYVIDSIDTIGVLTFVLAVGAVLVFILRRRLSLDILAALTFLVPFVFYIFSLYNGQASLFLPGAVPANAPYQLFNARYGAVIVAPAAFFLATLGERWSTLIRRWSVRGLRSAGIVALLAVIIAQSVLVARGGIISLQDGQYGLGCAPLHSTVIYLAQHYAGGKILEDLYTSKVDSLEPEAGIAFKNVVYEGSAALWEKALQAPASEVNWIIMNPKNPDDLVAKRIAADSPEFQTQFKLVIQDKDGLSLYLRNGAPISSAGPIPANLYHQCLAPGIGVQAWVSKQIVKK